MKLKKNKVLILTSILVLTLIYTVSSLEVNNTNYFCTSPNQTINFTNSYLDSIECGNYISITNLRLSDSANEKLTFNITTNNSQYFGNQLPYFLTSSNTNKVINSSINLNSTLTLSFTDCSNIGTISTSNNQKFQLPTCTGSSLVVLNNVILSNGLTTISIDYGAASIKTCNNFFTTGNSLIDFVVIFIIVACAIAAIYLISGGQEGTEIDLTSIAGIALVSFIVAIIGMIIINAIGGC